MDNELTWRSASGPPAERSSRDSSSASAGELLYVCDADTATIQVTTPTASPIVARAYGGLPRSRINTGTQAMRTSTPPRAIGTLCVDAIELHDQSETGARFRRRPLP